MARKYDPNPQQIDLHDQARQQLAGMTPQEIADATGNTRDSIYRKMADPPSLGWTLPDLLAIGRKAGKRLVFRGPLPAKNK